MKITRDIINPDINYDGMNREDLFRLINRWKRLLLFKHEVGPGDVMALGIFDVNHNHVACLFAAAELGLKIFIITKPISKETIHATKMGIFGPVDITVTQDLDPDDLHVEMFNRYSKKICYENEIDCVTNDNNVMLADICVDDPLIFASTSGTTGDSKPVFFTHKEVYEISKRNISVFGYTKASIIQQTMNMHHASAMLTYLFPTLMTCDTHYRGPIAHGPHIIKTVWSPKDFVEVCLVDKKVDNVICSNVFFLQLLMLGYSQAERWNEHRITLNMSGFPATKEIYDIAKRFPVNFISHYGSIDTGIPLIVNKITNESEYKQDYIGVVPDDFYRIAGDQVTCRALWDEARPLPDDLTYQSDGYYYSGRKNNTMIDKELIEILNDQLDSYDIIDDEGLTLVIWNAEPVEMIRPMAMIFKRIVNLNKEDFMVDTKVSMEQLRAYLRHNFA